MASEESQNSPSGSAPDSSPPVEGHAGELAAWLEARRRELDLRAAKMATQEADLEEKVEAARQWLEAERSRLDERAAELEEKPREETPPDQLQEIAQREADLDSRLATLHRETEVLAEGKASLVARSETLDAREADYAQRQRELEKAEHTLAEHTREANARAEALGLQQAELEHQRIENAAVAEEFDNRERGLEIRAREIDSALKRYEHLGAVEQRIEELQGKVLHAAQREGTLAEAESLLNEERASLSEAQAQLAMRQSEHDRRVEHDRQARESDQAAWRVESKSTAEGHARREAELDRREESLRRLERELQSGQREVLEMRLATEETWAQLTGLLTPAALSKSIAKVRVQLADHYQNTLRDIAESRGALRDAAARVEQEVRILEQRQISVEEWAARRHEEIGQAAARVEGRENELNRQQRAFEQQEARWAAERSAYREQILKLRVELDHNEPQAKAA